MNNILLVSPDVIIGASFLIFFTLLGFGLGFQSVLLSHIAFSIPIVVLMVLPKLQEMNDSMVDAARDLGANNFQVVKNIILPFLSPGIIAGYFMAFTYSLDDFAVTFFVTGNGFTTLSVEIYSRARQGISLEINALSALVFLFSMILVIGYYFISKENSPKRGKKIVEYVRRWQNYNEKLAILIFWYRDDYCCFVIRRSSIGKIKWHDQCQNFNDLQLGRLYRS